MEHRDLPILVKSLLELHNRGCCPSSWLLLPTGKQPKEELFIGCACGVLEVKKCTLIPFAFLVGTGTTRSLSTEHIARSPFGSWMRRECHRKGRKIEARFKLYSKGTQVLCITRHHHDGTVFGEVKN
ncbi:uncharacterized protein FN964_013743 [Alca torda]